MRYVLAPILAVAFLALYPQMSLWLARGAEWNGTYYVSNYDEPAYSAYVNAIIDGKPRKNDPFLGIDEAEYESLYSIQFIPAYVIALPARWLGLSASTAFILLELAIAILSVSAIFVFVRSAAENELLAATGTIMILGLGTAAAFQGELRHLISGRVLIDYLPFLRRYQPGLAFPLLFIFMLLVRRSFQAIEIRRVLYFAFVAGLVMVGLIYSYFFLWTAAAAWLVVFFVLHLATRPDARSRSVLGACVIALMMSVALVPYLTMLQKRSSNIDSVQLLERTHLPDLISPVVMIGFGVIVWMLLLAWRGKADVRDPLSLISISCAATPIVLLNQQVITGRSLQPVHYEIFVGNYLVLLAVVLAVGAVMKRQDPLPPFATRTLVYLAIFAGLWGLFESVRPVARNISHAVIRDKAAPAIRLVQASFPGKTPVVLSADNITSDFMPTVARVRPLWNPHTSSAGGVSITENKRLYHHFLYYSGYTDRDLREALAINVFEVTAAIFGSDRALPALAGGANPITRVEIEQEAAAYRKFLEEFDASASEAPVLDAAIFPVKAEPDLSNLDRWYRRDGGTDLGEFRVYRLTRRR